MAFIEIPINCHLPFPLAPFAPLTSPLHRSLSQLSKRGLESALEEAKQESLAAAASTTAARRQLTEAEAQCSKLEASNVLLKDLCSEQDQQLSELELMEERLEGQRKDG